MTQAREPAANLAPISWGVGALDLVLVIAGVAGWATLDVVQPGVFAAALLIRTVLIQIHLRVLLRPARRWVAAGDGASDALLAAADHAFQTQFNRLVLLYPVSWGAALALALAITVAKPELGIVPADAEYLVFGIGLAATLTLSFAFMHALASSIADEPIAALSRVFADRGVVPSRPPRPYAVTLRRFLLPFTVGMLLAALAIGGKARIDGLRERAIGDQIARAALAASELRAGRGLDESGLTRVNTADLPPVLGAPLDHPRLAAFDPTHARVLAAEAVDAHSWVVAEAAPDEQLTRLVILVLALVTALGVASQVAALSIGSSLTKPLAELRSATRQMVEDGELGALGRVIARHDDEVGALIRDFNLMLDMLLELVEAAKSVAGGELHIELEHRGELHDAFTTMVTQLAQLVSRMRGAALDVSTASAEIHANTEGQQHAAKRLAVEVEQVSATTGSLAHTATEINEAAARVLAFAEHSRANVDTLATNIEELDRRVAGIAELLDVIREIAERTDLLALNGSLEATRAGEAGRGFALVAAEMRRLAERVTGIVADVRVQIRDIEASGAVTIAATDQSRQLAQDTALAARDISRLTQTQREDTDRASATALAMADFVTASAVGVDQTRATVDGLREQVAELETLTKSFSSS